MTGPTYPDGSPIEPQNLEALTEYAESYRKAEPLPALHQLREDQALGAAWRRCEAALPEGWGMSLNRSAPQGDYAAWAYRFGGNPQGFTAGHPTPIAALDALADKLEAGNA